ncbi:MAG: diguanylate cyclase, partial [Campylobacteraceae bacterium]|nr:diguanylate cyclase [Campylobacteraceae bacterium]
MRAYFIYLSIFVTIIFSICMATQQFILNSYISIEDSQNLRIQNSIAKSLDDYGFHVEKIIKDYAKWDESYLFLEGNNPNYVQRNFHGNSNTLEAFSICTVQFLSKDFRSILRLDSNVNKHGKELGNKLLKTPQKTHGGFLEAGGIVYYYYTHPVMSSDATLPSNGFLQGAFELSAKALLSRSVELTGVEFFSPKSWSGTEKEYILKTDGVSLWTKTVKTKNEIENYFLIYSEERGPIREIKTTHERTFYLEGERTVFLFLSSVAGLIVLFFALVFYRQKELEGEKNRLELAIIDRTKDLNSTMKELRKTVEKLKTIAYIDELTGIKTRRAFFEIVSPLLEESFVKDKTLCIALIDLDDFKSINDTYGHAAG